MDAQQALEKLAAWFEAQEKIWREMSKKSDSEASKEYWRGTANAYRDCAEQLRGLMYELKNPVPTGPWDSAGHMEDEQLGWADDHPLSIPDEMGIPHIQGVFYR